MRCNPPARVLARLGQVDLLASAGLSVVSSLFGGESAKDKTRDQQEAQRYQMASGGDVTSAQGIYHDSLPQNKQTAERIKDDQGYWTKLMSAGWTVDSGGTMHPPGAIARAINTVTTGQPAGPVLTAAGVPVAGKNTAVYVVGGIAAALGLGLLLARRPAA
jgi:hypothetical protein